MNLYECIFQVSNCIKEREEVKELIEKNKKVKELKQDIKYNAFFLFNEGKEFYNFFAPNISLQIVNNIYKNSDFKIISKEECELILNNKDIKDFVKISTHVNEIVTKEIMNMYTPNEQKGDLKITYIYNRLSEKLGYIGVLENLKLIAGKGEELERYYKERNKIIEPSIKLFPIHKFDNEFLKKVYEQDVSKQCIEAFERFNIILYIIERIIYCNVYDKILYLKRENVKFIDETEKYNIFYKKMLINNVEILFNHFPILVLDDDYYFPYSEQCDLLNGDSTIKSFSCKLNDKNSLLNLSIINTIDLFKED